MSKFIPGEQALTELVCRDFELFYDYVKKDLLQPYNNVRKPKSPPDISYKINHKKELYRKLDLLKRRNPILTKSKEEKISLAQKDIDAFGWEVIYSKSAFSEYEYLKKEAKSLEEELSQIDNIYSWKNYDLPDSETQAKGVLKHLVDSLYIEEEVLKIKQLIKGPPQKTTTKAPDATQPVGIREGPLSPEKLTLEDLKELPKKLPRWITLYDLMNRWNKKDFELLGYVKSSGLTAYYNTHDPIPKNNPYPLNEYSIFNLSEVEEFEKKYPEVLAERARPQGEKDEIGDKRPAPLEKDEYLKNPALIESIRKAKNEIGIIHNALVRNVGFSGRMDPDHADGLKQEAIDTFTNQKDIFKFMKEEYLQNPNLYNAMLASPGHELRYFEGTLLQRIVKDLTKKKIAKDKLRNL